MMSLLEKIFSSSPKVKGDVSEDEYYKKLFIENPKWNTSQPNDEENERWDIIRSFVQYIKDWREQNGKADQLAILDLGCGRGWLTHKLSAYGNVIGIEPVKEVVKYGKKLFPRIDLRFGTAQELLKNDYTGKFDLIVSSEVIEHVHDNEKNNFVSDIRTLLKEDGFAIITTPRKDAQQEWLQYLSMDQPIEDWLDEATLKALFTSAGFKDHKVERYSIQPKSNAPKIEVYQLWIFQKK